LALIYGPGAVAQESGRGTTVSASANNEWLQCVACGAQYPISDNRYSCRCESLLSVQRPPTTMSRIGPADFDARLGRREVLDQSGVWRFRECVLGVPEELVISHPEGSTHLYHRPQLSGFAGIAELYFKHEGENPTGSFKDRGITVAITQASRVRAPAVACASTGNTSASLAAYAAQAGKKALVFVPEGKISASKMIQTLAYGALCLKVAGDFDTAMRLVREVCEELGLYLLNSVNPFRIEGQKTIAWELLQDLRWDPPDWIALPAGNLGNTSAIGKGLEEAFSAGWISKLPRLAAIQASGANPFHLSYQQGFSTRPKVKAETIASAIRIGDPVSFDKARAAIVNTRGVVSAVTDAELLLAKRHIDRAGIGCEPASACSLAGVKKLREQGIIRDNERVVCILTGNLLKDPDAVLAPIEGAPSVEAQMISVKPELQAVADILETRL
jgi:threonine synthase